MYYIINILSFIEHLVKYLLLPTRLNNLRRIIMRDECKKCGLCKNLEKETFEGEFIELNDDSIVQEESNSESNI